MIWAQEDIKEGTRRLIRVLCNSRVSKMINIQSSTTILWFQAKSHMFQLLCKTALKDQRNNKPLTGWFITICSRPIIFLKTTSTALKGITLLQIRSIERAKICPTLQTPTYKRLAEVLKSTRKLKTRPDFTRKKGQSHLKLKISRIWFLWKSKQAICSKNQDWVMSQKRGGIYIRRLKWNMSSQRHPLKAT